VAEKHLILGIGELLWDLLPDGPRLGGAPANFSVMAARLGNHAVLLSRVGQDERGREAVEQLSRMEADSGYLQADKEHETGRVSVVFAAGEPHYTIHCPAAWDFLELSGRWVEMAERADALCFGSLAQRLPASRRTIQSLVAQSPASCLRVFDVNLRAPFYAAEVIQQSMELATAVKMNDAELPMVLELLGMPPEEKLPLKQGAERLLREFPSLQWVAVTRGGQGSLLVSRTDSCEHPGFAVKVADPIGAGDAFTAAMTHQLLLGAPLAKVNEVANRCGAWMTSQAGAMPPLSEALRAQIAAEIQGDSVSGALVRESLFR
jgi:fructokinase